MYSYKVETLDIQSGYDDWKFDTREENLLSELDSEGWECFSIVKIEGTVRYYAKRSVEIVEPPGNMDVPLTAEQIL